MCIPTHIASQHNLTLAAGRHRDSALVWLREDVRRTCPVAWARHSTESDEACPSPMLSPLRPHDTLSHTLQAPDGSADCPCMLAAFCKVSASEVCTSPVLTVDTDSCQRGVRLGEKARARSLKISKITMENAIRGEVSRAVTWAAKLGAPERF